MKITERILAGIKSTLETGDKIKIDLREQSALTGSGDGVGGRPHQRQSRIGGVAKVRIVVVTHAGGQLPVVSGQLSVASCRWSVVSCQLSVVRIYCNGHISILIF